MALIVGFAIGALIGFCWGRFYEAARPPRWFQDL
jgi:hypothetical protein